MNQQRLFSDQGMNTDDLSPEDTLLLSFRLYGFVLQTLTWASFDIDYIQTVVQDRRALDYLVLPDRHKDILVALVTNHEPARDKSQELDLVLGKESGLVSLLHGMPGVGKTFTAECIAESTGRPLFAITCGDVAVEAAEVERNLEEYFQLASKWGCILLLEEADVFLAKRTRTDMRGNAVISVFLKLLEYNSGIFILTTNRVGTFDKAFISRMHLSLYYPPLTRESTQMIWEMLIKRTRYMGENRNEKIMVNKHSILDFAISHYNKLKWNGRQIHHAFQSALALAKYEAGRRSRRNEILLEATHFEAVAKSSRAFEDYLTQTFGGLTETDRARQEQLRDDQFALDTGDQRRPGGVLGAQARKQQRLSRFNDDDDSD